MTGIKKIITVLFVFTALIPGLSAGESLRNPYQILEKVYEAMGGLDAVRAESTLYVEASIYIMGLNGKATQWSKKPAYSRAEVNVGTLTIIEGHNERCVWTKASYWPEVEIKDDPATLKRIQIDNYMAEYEFLNPSSSICSLSYEGISQSDNVPCYLIKVTTTINDDYTLYYIDTTTFCAIKEIEIEYEPYKKTITVGSDFRVVNGIRRAFVSEITSVSTGKQDKITFRFIKCEPNVEIDNSIFDPPQ